MNLSLFREYGTLKQRHADSKEETKRLRALLDSLQDKLIDTLLNEGVGNLPLDIPDVGSVLLYPRVKLFAKAKDGDVDRLHSALHNAGLGDLVRPTVNSQTLSAIVRESEKPDGEPLPKELRDALHIGESHELAMRKQG